MSSEWDLLWRLAVPLVLSSAIGLEREMRQKSAGLRTHSLVGLGAALFVLVSTYGFSDVLDQDHVVLDPGLTTAAGVWVTAAVGTAAGAGLAILAAATTGAYFLVAYGYPVVVDRLPRSRWASQSLRLTYLDGRGILRDALALCTAAGFAVADLAVHHLGDRDDAVAVQLELRGPGSLTGLATELGALDGVLAVGGEDLTGPRTKVGVMEDEVVIKVRDNGPYKVTGPVTVVDAEGHRFDLPEGPIALCRCGQSGTKPFCDASHRTSGFDACERAGA